MTTAGIFLLAYLMGAIPTSWLAARLGAGIDLRQHGSKNLGATNVFRVLGWKYAIPVGVFDVAKGAVPVLVLAPLVESSQEWMPLAVGLTAILGHVYSAFVGFRGGKGVATAAGVVLGLAPLPLLASAAIWAAVLKFTGYVSLASMLGAVVFPVAAWVVRPEDRYLPAIGTALALFIIFTHRSNIRRLLAGTESRFGHRREA